MGERSGDRTALIDVDQATRHLRHLDATASQFIFYALGHGTEGGCSHHVSDFAKAIRWLMEQQSAGRSVYVAAQQMRARKRLNSDVVRFRAIFADLDHGLPKRSFPLEPSLITQTSASNGEERYQAQWIIAAGPDQLDEHQWRGVMRRLGEYGADIAAAKPAQGLRLAGTRNLKPDRNSFQVQLVHESGTAYSGAQILKAFPPLAPPVQEWQPSAYAAGEQRAKPTGAMEKRHRAYFERGFAEETSRLSSLAKGGRNDAVYRAACRWGQYVHHGVASKQEFLNGLMAACQANGLLQEDAKACKITVEGGYRKASHDRLHDLPDRPRNSTQRSTPKTQPPAGPDGTDLDAKVAWTETAVADLFEREQTGKLLYEHRRGMWYACDEHGVWRPDELRSSQRKVQNLCVGLGAPSFQALKRIRAVEEIAKTSEALAITSDAFDQDPFILGTPAGHVDLKTGTVLRGDPARRVTMATAVAPLRMATPTWDRFLGEATAGNAGVIRFLRQFAGYCLTGDTSEQCMIFMHGPGGSGKGTFLGTIAEILDSYAWAAPIEAFSSGPDKHPTTFAAMVGRRLVTSSETEQGRKWAEAKIKHITGQDRINARFMRRDEFQYQPAFKLIISGNHEPGIESCDEAMRRRFHVVPFDRKFDRGSADKKLKEKLRLEWPGILQWAIDGCLDWQKNGLVVPDKVSEATKGYFERQDTFRQWLDQETAAAPDAEAVAPDLYASWKRFATALGEDVGSAKALTAKLRTLGFKQAPYPVRRAGRPVRVWKGINLLDAWGDVNDRRQPD